MEQIKGFNSFFVSAPVLQDDLPAAPDRHAWRHAYPHLAHLLSKEKMHSTDVQPHTTTWNGFSPSFEADCGGTPPSNPVPVRRNPMTSEGKVYGHTLRPAGWVDDLPHAKDQHEGRSHSTQHKHIVGPEEAEARENIEADKLGPPRSVVLAQLESLFAAMECDIAEVANHGVAKVNSLPFKECLHVSRSWLPPRHKVAETRAGKKKMFG